MAETVVTPSALRNAPTRTERYTERNLDTVFAPELPDLSRQQIRDWYKGCSRGGEERVYSPFDGWCPFNEGEP